MTKSIVDIVAEEIQERKMQAAGMERGPDGNWYPIGVRPAHSLTREDARDPAKYRAAKLAAEQAGATVSVIDGDTDPTIRNTDKRAVMESKVATFDNKHTKTRWVRADLETGTGLVQRRLQAEREGFNIRTFHTLDDLPDHDRTIFRLQENAANAES